jgi:TonB-linked SusC/RagA family outer membrane protein
MKPPYEMANVQEYIQALNKAHENSNLALPFPNPSEYANRESTPWWDTGIAGSAPQLTANISARGGSDIHKYSASLSYNQQESFYKLAPNGGDWQRFTARVTNDWSFARWISAGFMFNPRFTTSGSPGNWGDYLNIDPITPIYKPAEELTGTENEYSVYGRSNLSYVFNPVASNKRFFDRRRNYGLSGNAYVDIRPLNGLVFRSFLGYDYRLNTRDRFQPDFVVDTAHEKQEVNNVARWHDFYNSFSWQNTLSYLRTFNDVHNLNLMIGSTMDRDAERTLNGSRDGVPSNVESMREVSAGTTNYQVAGSSEISQALLSYFGRVNYNYDNRYLATATIRRDGSSKFMARNKWATFPSASLAWNISNESFMESTKSWLGNLKLRAGWGQVGNQSLPSAVYLSSLAGASNTNVYVYNESIVNMTYINTLKNEDIKWETVEDISMGVDFSLWNDKLSGSVDYYIKNTKDMLFQRPYPQYSGFPNSARIWTNVGSMRSQGWDINLTHRNRVGDFRYSLALNLTTFNVEVTQMATSDPIYGAAIPNSSVNRSITEVGYEPGAFYGYVMDGLFQTQAEVDAHVGADGTTKLQPSAAPGDIRIKNLNGDNAINDAGDRTRIGSPWADFTAGLNINLAYKGFDMMAMLYGSYGNELANWDVTNGLHSSGGSNYIKDINDIAWNGPGTSNRIPRLTRSDPNNNYGRFSTLHVEDGSYLRLKNIQFGYTLPKSVTDKIGFSSMRVSVSGLNLLTFTKFTGTDPEIYGGSVTGGFGFAGWTYPQLKTIIFGVNVSF